MAIPTAIDSVPAEGILKEFPGRYHYTLGQAGGEEVADYALDWAIEPTATAPQPA